MKDEKLISILEPDLQNEVEEILEHWDDPGRCARAELYGIADRIEDIKVRKTIYEFLKNNLLDGFTRQFALKNDITLERAQLLVDVAINDARRWFNKEMEEK